MPLPRGDHLQALSPLEPGWDVLTPVEMSGGEGSTGLPEEIRCKFSSRQEGPALAPYGSNGKSRKGRGVPVGGDTKTSLGSTLPIVC